MRRPRARSACRCCGWRAGAPVRTGAAGAGLLGWGSGGGAAGGGWLRLGGGLVSLWLLATPLVADALSRAAEGEPALDLTRAPPVQAIVILGGGDERLAAPEYGGGTPPRAPPLPPPAPQGAPPPPPAPPPAGSPR